MAYERESIIEKHLVAEVKKAGGRAYKFVSPGRRSVPDRIVLLPGGRLVFVESTLFRWGSNLLCLLSLSRWLISIILLLRWLAARLVTFTHRLETIIIHLLVF